MFKKSKNELKNNLISYLTSKQQIRVLAVDPGITSSAFVVANVNMNLTERVSSLCMSTLKLQDVLCSEDFEVAEVIDITNIDHSVVDERLCTLDHSKTLSCRMKHLFQETTFFETCDLIVIEKQPPNSAGQVMAEIIDFHFNNECSMNHKFIVYVAPQTLHSFLNIGCLNYNQRKTHNASLALQWIPKNLSSRITSCIDRYCSNNKKDQLRDDEQENSTLDAYVDKDHLIKSNSDRGNFSNLEDINMKLLLQDIESGQMEDLRVHDIGDAMCMIFWFISEHCLPIIQQSLYNHEKTKAGSFASMMEQYRYVNKRNLQDKRELKSSRF